MSDQWIWVERRAAGDASCCACGGGLDGVYVLSIGDDRVSSELVLCHGHALQVAYGLIGACRADSVPTMPSDAHSGPVRPSER